MTTKINPAAAGTQCLMADFYRSTPERAEYAATMSPEPVYRFEIDPDIGMLPALEAVTVLHELAAILPEDGKRRTPSEARLRMSGTAERDAGPWDEMTPSGHRAPYWLSDMPKRERAEFLAAFNLPPRFLPDTEQTAAAYLMLYGVRAVAQCGNGECARWNATNRLYAGQYRPSYGTNSGSNWGTPDPYELYGFCSTDCRNVTGDIRRSFWREFDSWLPKYAAGVAAEAERLRARVDDLQDILDVMAERQHEPLEPEVLARVREPGVPSFFESRLVAAGAALQIIDPATAREAQR